MENMGLSEYEGKRVFVTGHTGFKGAWLCRSLLQFKAQVCGYALNPPTKPSLFEILSLEKEMKSVIGDIRDYEHLMNTVREFKPDIILHLAAQPIVTEGYANPRYTYETNVMGTVNILEAARNCESVSSVINVTTDKVYKNNEWVWGYRETDELNGYDPYSNSKSCSELVTSSYIKSFFAMAGIPVSTVRAGNVIGGGDFAQNRIIPDAYRAAINNEVLELRSPKSIRPYQHVLEAIFAYMYLALMQQKDKSLADSYNIGPNDNNCVTTERIADMFCKSWGDVTYKIGCGNAMIHEANYLKLDCSKIKNRMGWKQLSDIEDAVSKTVEVYKEIACNGDADKAVEKQINDYARSFEENIVGCVL